MSKLFFLLLTLFPTMVEVPYPCAPFRMSATEITNAQYEAFDPSHRALRGDGGFSVADDEAVVNVSWHDALAYCDWLSRQTGKHYTLPTEEQWEFACGSDTLSPALYRHQQTERNLVAMPLTVATGSPNAYGLYDMLGNVEEWCADLYTEGFAATRGGSHNTPMEYVRREARMAAIPTDRHTQIGFRVIECDPSPLPAEKAWFHTGRPPRVKQSKGIWKRPSKAALWLEPEPFVIAPDSPETPFYSHNHQPAVTWCDNGDLLAIWFTCEQESGREMVVLSSRFRKGRWAPASLFFSVPSRNVTGSALAHLPDGTLLHMNGVANSGDWQNLALCMRRSSDNGKTWSLPQLVEPRHEVRHQVIAGTLVLRDGTLLQCCDAGAGGQDGTAVHISTDDGLSWQDTGGTIRGIHASVVELSDGTLLAFGRGLPIDGRMPKSVSTDRGRSWQYSASAFPPIDSGQRLVLRRLNEGPIMLVSFGEQGMFAALSYDEGETWPVSKLLTDGSGRTYDGGAWTGSFTMDPGHAEPKGYLACTQTPDGVIHLLSSRLHYRFNLAWLEQ